MSTPGIVARLAAPVLPDAWRIVRLIGGDASNSRAAVCVDLDPGNVPWEWSALVEAHRVDELLEQTGARLCPGTEPETWDGDTFGDGTGGTVEWNPLTGEPVGRGLNEQSLR